MKIRNKRLLTLLLLAIGATEASAQSDSCALLRSSFSIDSASPSQTFNMATCESIEGNKRGAFEYLSTALDKGYNDVEWLMEDSDLANIRSDKRWLPLVDRAKKVQQTYFKRINVELYKMHQADQADRRKVIITGELNWDQVSKNDAKRRLRVQQLLDNKQLIHSDDFYRAAMIFQHGDTTEEYRMAYELAKKAVTINPDNDSAKWLSCAAQDRYLIQSGQSQIWGTQLSTKPAPNGKHKVLYLKNFDTTARPDSERVLCGLPTLAEMYRRIAKMSSMPDSMEQYRYWKTGM